MKKTELALVFLVLIGIIMKYNHIEGAGLVLVISMLSLSVFYYAFGFALFNNASAIEILKNSPAEQTSARRIIGCVGLGISFSMILNGSLFKLQFWEGAGLQLMWGLVVVAIIAVVATILYLKNRNNFYHGIFKRVAITGSLGLILFLTPSTTLVDFFHGDNPAYANLFKQSLEDPYNEELQMQLDQMRREMRDQ